MRHLVGSEPSHVGKRPPYRTPLPNVPDIVPQTLDIHDPLPHPEQEPSIDATQKEVVRRFREAPIKHTDGVTAPPFRDELINSWESV